MTEYKSTCLLSKKKYKELKEKFESHADKETAEILLKDVCEVLNFNPLIGLYNKEIGKKMIEYRNKKAEEAGLSLYQWRKQNKKNKEIK
jgi:hypothetical protein